MWIVLVVDCGCDNENLHGWYASTRCVHVQNVSNGLRKMWPWRLVFVSIILYNHRDFDLGKKKGREVSQKICVYAAQLYSTLSYFTLLYILEKKRSWLYFSTSVVLFLSAMQVNDFIYIFSTSHLKKNNFQIWNYFKTMTKLLVIILTFVCP